jgi:hypothetical protein
MVAARSVSGLGRFVAGEVADPEIGPAAGSRISTISMLPARRPWRASRMPVTLAAGMAGKLTLIRIPSPQAAEASRRITSGAQCSAALQEMLTPLRSCDSAIAGMSSRVASIAAAMVPE